MQCCVNTHHSPIHKHKGVTKMKKLQTLTGSYVRRGPLVVGRRMARADASVPPKPEPASSPTRRGHIDDEQQVGVFLWSVFCKASLAPPTWHDAPAGITVEPEALMSVQKEVTDASWVHFSCLKTKWPIERSHGGGLKRKSLMG